MRNIIYSEIAPDFLIQGLGLHAGGQSEYVGKIGRHEVILFPSAEGSLQTEGEVQFLQLGSAPAGNQFRTGDILMVGSDELLDRTFKALDEIEQRGLVVTLVPSNDPSQIYVAKEDLLKQIQIWREGKVPFLCLLMVEPLEIEDQAKLVNLVRKIIN
ncbi:MAG: hypothetical protein ACYCVD_06635 [Desulfitobacteriaceae bacterium]